MAALSSSVTTEQNPAKDGPSRDFRQEVTDSLIKMVEQSVAPLQKPWEPSVFQMPHNPTAEKNYRGVNAIHLLAVQTRKGYEDPIFYSAANIHKKLNFFIYRKINHLLFGFRIARFTFALP